MIFEDEVFSGGSGTLFYRSDNGAVGVDVACGGGDCTLGGQSDFVVGGDVSDGSGGSVKERELEKV